MPIDYKKYPADWKLRRKFILMRAKNRCEFCGVENHQVNVFTGSMVVLTIAHLHYDENKTKYVSLLDLKALCQRCHFKLDLSHNLQKRRETMKRRKRQIEMSL